MKSYKDFGKEYIGSSDIASLVMVGYKEGEGVVPQMLNFGRDGSYRGYIVKGSAEIGEHYEKVCEYENWLRLYDDNGLTWRFTGERITVYRAGEMGCIFQIFD